MSMSVMPVTAKKVTVPEDRSLIVPVAAGSTEKATPFAVGLSEHAAIRYELVNLFKATSQQDEASDSYGDGSTPPRGYDDSFLIRYPLAYRRVLDVWTGYYSGDELAARLTDLDAAYSQAVTEAATDLSGKIAPFFSSFDSRAFQSHLRLLADKALSVVQETVGGEAYLEKSIRYSLRSTARKSAAPETMAYSDIQALSDLSQELPPLSAIAVNQPEDASALIKTWYREERKAYKVLSTDFIKKQVQKAVEQRVQHFHTAAAIRLVIDNYDHKLGELCGNLEELTDEYKKVSKHLAATMKQKEKAINDIPRWLKRQNQLSSQITDLRVKISSVTQERNEFLANPETKVQHTQEFRQLGRTPSNSAQPEKNKTATT